MLGVEAVVPDGELVTFGGPALDPPGVDLLAALVGSEGTLAVVTKATLRLLRRPEAVLTLLAGFNSIDEAGEAVSGLYRVSMKTAGRSVARAIGCDKRTNVKVTLNHLQNPWR